VTAVIAVLAAGLLVAGGASADPAGIAAKRAQADRVLAEVREIDVQVGLAAEAWNAANIRLATIEGEQRRNQKLLKLASSNLGAAQKTLEERLVALYTSDSSAGSPLEVILGAEGLDDLLDRIDTASRVSAQDARILGQVKQLRAQVQDRKAKLARARAEQASVVAQKAAQKAQIEAKLAERERLLGTIRSEIERLEAEERRRQAAIARQVRARLAAQQAASAAAASAAPDQGAPAADVPVSAPDPSAPAEPAGAPPAARYGGVVGIAMKYLGVPYRWGGASPSTGFDCSGLSMYVYAQIGVSLPHNAAAQYNMGTPVSRSQLQPGDLVFFHGLGHMGIYVGGGQFIHAPQTGDVVKISSLSGWYSSRYVGARRL
jgi:cell wall-associated NlpC family hydrolase